MSNFILKVRVKIVLRRFIALYLVVYPNWIACRCATCSSKYHFERYEYCARAVFCALCLRAYPNRISRRCATCPSKYHFEC